MKNITALIVDDVAEMRQLLRSILRETGCEVLGEARDGAQALSAIERDKPDMLFLDLDMPGMSGIELLEILQTVPNAPYTVIVSGDISSESQGSALAHGAKGFIGKPYTAQAVSEALQGYATQRDAANACTALIADDDALMRDLLKNALEKQQCRVIHAVENGAEAIRYLEQNAEPDIVFLDIDMPIMNGLGALQKIRESKRTVFCAMVSAHSTFVNVKNAMNQGADGFIVKPYTEDKIRQIIGKYRMKNGKA